MNYSFHPVLDASVVGTDPATAKADGGYVGDAVLEYRVCCHPECGAPDLTEGSDCCYVFEEVEQTLAFSQETSDAQKLMALIVQAEYIDQPEKGAYVVEKRRVTEWSVKFLQRPRRTSRTLEGF